MIIFTLYLCDRNFYVKKQICYQNSFVFRLVAITNGPITGKPGTQNGQLGNQRRTMPVFTLILMVLGKLHLAMKATFQFAWYQMVSKGM